MADQARPPTPLGPYTPVTRAGMWVICSGQLGLRDGELVDGVAAQTAQSVANLAAALALEGATLEDVVKTTVFLADIADFEEMNGAYAAAFRGHRPTRSCIGVAGLPRGARVEIEAWAQAEAHS
ncbi:MAG TPA: RidA family protein [Acidimicrobiales bacterium]|nr:RidA family protein [Acidimicrobiales bacterium]